MPESTVMRQIPTIPEQFNCDLKPITRLNVVQKKHCYFLAMELPKKRFTVLIHSQQKPTQAQSQSDRGDDSDDSDDMNAL